METELLKNYQAEMENGHTIAAELLLKNGLEKYPSFCRVRKELLAFYDKGVLPINEVDRLDILLDQIENCPEEKAVYPEVLPILFRRAERESEPRQRADVLRLACTAFLLSKGKISAEYFSVSRKLMNGVRLSSDENKIGMRTNLMSAGVVLNIEELRTRFEETAVTDIWTRSRWSLVNADLDTWKTDVEIFRLLVSRKIVYELKTSPDKTPIRDLVWLLSVENPEELRLALREPYKFKPRIDSLSRSLSLFDEASEQEMWLELYFLFAARPDISSEDKGSMIASLETYISGLKESFKFPTAGTTRATRFVTTYLKVAPQLIQYPGVNEINEIVEETRNLLTKVKKLESLRLTLDQVKTADEVARVRDEVATYIDPATPQWNIEIIPIKNAAELKYQELSLKEAEAEEQRVQAIRRNEEAKVHALITSSMQESDYYRLRKKWKGEPQRIQGIRDFEVKRVTVTGNTAVGDISVVWEKPREQSRIGLFLICATRDGFSWSLTELKEKGADD